ncbi:MAG TPA: hypothetical protein VK996_14250 [Ramlibacter sp.]|nr:hypothetical protein [Ramlibacter sp.]
MKAYYLLAGIGLAVLGGCTINPPVAYTTTPAVVATSPTYIAPTYVAPTYRIIP